MNRSRAEWTMWAEKRKARADTPAAPLPEVSFDISLQREYARQSGAPFGEVVNTGGTDAVEREWRRQNPGHGYQPDPGPLNIAPPPRDMNAGTFEPSRRQIIAGRLYPLVLLCKAHGLPEPMPEFNFHPTRGWRADYCWQAQKIIVEIDGGVFTGGRHVRGQGFIEDQRKLNAATLLGYRVLRYTPDRLGEAIEDLRELLG
jgi:hypothetical protein